MKKKTAKPSAAKTADQLDALRRENRSLRQQLAEAHADIQAMAREEEEEAYNRATRMEARSMAGIIVNCIPESRTILTKEVKSGNGTAAAVCNIEGEPIQDNGVTYAGPHPDHVEIYLDTISGQHMAKVSISQATKLRADGEKVYQGVGGVQGWFIEAPDFTISGRHGSESKPKAEKPAEPQRPPKAN
jgi:hypothetical protein